ncbi:MAG: hypothetical protein LBH55_01685 [Mycoplasmataceae bacterium]|jgi:hypothetical protein|nr:hypothetical protein [Mycoplasmataceae bacterium]
MKLKKSLYGNNESYTKIKIKSNLLTIDALHQARKLINDLIVDEENKINIIRNKPEVADE